MWQCTGSLWKIFAEMIYSFGTARLKSCAVLHIGLHEWRYGEVGKRAQKDSQDGWNQDRRCCPFQTSGLLFDGQTGGGAGPVEEAEDHHAQGGLPGPAVGYQKV